MTRARSQLPAFVAPSIEQVFAGAGFADVHASPLQRAVCRAADGLPIGDDLSDADVMRYFGCEREALGLTVPQLVVLVCGVRGGKSFLAVAGATADVLRADCSAAKPHEVVRHVVIGPSTDAATATFRLLVGVWRSSPILSAMIVGDPTADTITIRRPDSRLFEIVVRAARADAIALRSRWLAGFTLEEVAGFGIESQGAVVNAEELLRVGVTRLLPGTQGRLISSPFGKQGLLYRVYREHFGDPSAAALVVHAPTRAMNPSFPQATIDAIRARDPDTAAREYDAAWIDPDTAYLSSQQVEACVRARPLVREAWHQAVYVAALDAGFRGNATTLVVARAVPVAPSVHRIEVAGAWEWKGSKEKPLSPHAVLVDVAAQLRPFNVHEVACDGHSFDALRDLASPLKLRLVQKGVSDRDAGYAALATAIGTGPEAIELPPVPQLVADLKGLRKVLTPNGARITLPLTPDGRHCDYAPSLALVVLAANGRAQAPGSRMFSALKSWHARGGSDFFAAVFGHDTFH